MPSFILRDLDPAFWTRVQTKAKTDGTTVKALILKLLAQWLGAAVLVLAVILLSACAPSPLAPTPVAPSVDPAAPYSLTLSAAIGTGTDAGHSTVTAHLTTIAGGKIAGAPITFTTDVGSLSPAASPTIADGTAFTVVTAGTTATVTATAGSLTAKTIVPSEPATPVIPPSPPPPVTPPPPVIPPTPAPTPAPSYGVTVAAAPSALVAGTSSTLTATVTLANGATVPTAYAWDCQGDGVTIVTTLAPTNFTICTYSTAGAITSKVTARNGTTSGLGTVAVTVATAAPLTVAIVPATSTPTINVSDNFTATVTSSGPVPALLQWEWDTDGSGIYEVTIGSAANPNVQAITFGTHAVWTVKVRVTDLATGRTALSSVQVTVP